MKNENHLLEKKKELTWEVFNNIKVAYSGNSTVAV